MDAVKLFLLWLALKVRNAIIIYVSITLLAYAIEFMSRITETAQEVLANPKTTGTVAAGGSGTVLYNAFVAAAPDILIMLSIVATMLTIWAHFAARKRHKREDQLREQKAQDEAFIRKLEIDRLKKDIAERDETIMEARVRSQAAEMFFEHMKKKDPEMAEEIQNEIDERVIDFLSKKQK